MEEDGFSHTGFWSIAILYLFYCPFGFLGAAIVNKLTPKWAMVVGAITFIPFIASFILPSLYKEYQDNHDGEKPPYGIL